MSTRQIIMLGFASLAIILASGVLMTIFVLKQEAAQIDQAEWDNLTQTLNQLIETVESQATRSGVSQASGGLTASIPINTADQAQLERLSGIGPVRAQAILEARQAGGPFRDLDDLRARVSKIPRSVLDEITLQITFE